MAARKPLAAARGFVFSDFTVGVSTGYPVHGTGLYHYTIRRLMDVFVFKLNGWSDHFSERIEALARSVDSITVFRSRPEQEDDLSDFEGVSVVDLSPARGTFVEPERSKPLVFLAHVIQAIVLALLLMLRRRSRPDAVHALDYILGGFAARVTSLVSGVPLVVSVRGLKEPAYRNMVEEAGTLRAKVNYRILLTLSSVIIPGADHIITKAAYQRDFVERTYDVDCGFTTVPTGVDFETFDPDAVGGPDPFAQLFPDTDVEWERATVLLFLGKFITRKGFEQYVSFAESLDSELDDDVVFTAVGGYRDSAFRDRLQPRIRDLDERFLVYPDRVDFDLVPRLLAFADATVLLSEAENEGVPRSLQESCAMRTPVIASDVVGIRDAFADVSGCYLIDRDDPQTFKTAVEEIAEGHIRTDRTECRKAFDIYSNYAEYAGVYSSLST